MPGHEDVGLAQCQKSVEEVQGMPHVHIERFEALQVLPELEGEHRVQRVCGVTERVAMREDVNVESLACHRFRKLVAVDRGPSDLGRKIRCDQTDLSECAAIAHAIMHPCSSVDYEVIVRNKYAGRSRTRYQGIVRSGMRL